MPTLYCAVGIERWICSSLDTFSKTYLLLKAHLFTLTSLLKQRSISLCWIALPSPATSKRHLPVKF